MNKKDIIVSDHLLEYAKRKDIPKDVIVNKVKDETLRLKKLIRSRFAKRDPLEVTRIILNDLDKIADKYIQKYKLKITCSSGCSHCCHQAIIISDREEEIIKDYVKRISYALFKKLEKQAGFTKEDYYNADEKTSRCIFLIDNKCKIYPVRPAACRNFFVKNKPEYCKSEYHSKRDEYPLDICIIAPLYIASSAFYNLSGSKPSSMAERLFRCYKSGIIL